MSGGAKRKQVKRWSRRNAVAIQKWLTIMWVLLIVPSVTVWKDSIQWVILMSVWANVAGHWAAYEAARDDSEDEVAASLSE